MFIRGLGTFEIKVFVFVVINKVLNIMNIFDVFLFMILTLKRRKKDFIFVIILWKNSK